MDNSATDPQVTIQPTELPIWMRRAMRGNDYGALLTLAFGALLVWYFIVGPQLPQTNATTSYIYLTQDYAQSFLEGRFYPRWSPHALQGLGAPIPHFHPPAAPYLSGLLTVIVTNDAATAVRIVYALGMLLGGVGIYGLIVRHRGAPAAVLGALLYLTTPYIGLTAPHILGDFPGTLALGLLPIFLWATDRLVTMNYPQDLAFAAGALWMLILTDPTVAAVGSLIALVLSLWNGWQHRASTLRNLFRVLLIAISSSAFFWAPALADLNTVQWARIVETSRPMFLTWRGLIEPFRQVDPNALIPSPALMIGRLHILVFVLSLMQTLRKRQQLRFEALFVLLSSLTLLLVMTLFRSEIWLLGLLGLCIGASSGAALSLRDTLTIQQQRLILAIAILIVLGHAAPIWLPPDPGPVQNTFTPADQLAYEQRGYGVATVAPGAWYPTALASNTRPRETFLRAYQEGIIDRFNTGTQDNQVRISLLEQRSHYARYQASAVGGGRQLNMLLPYFPGWRVQLNNQTLPTTAQPNTGLIQFNLPPVSNGTLVVRLGTTPLRTVSWVLSSLGLLTVILMSLRRYRETSPQYHDTKLLTLPEVRLLTLLYIFAALIVIFTASPNAPLSVREQNGSELAGSTLLQSRTDAGITLLAFRADESQLRYGDTLEFTLYWSTLERIEQNYRVQINLYSEITGTTLSKSVTRYPAGYPTSRWMIDQLVADTHVISVPDGITPGPYIVGITLTPCAAETRCAAPDVSFFDSAGRALGQNYILPLSLEILPK